MASDRINYFVRAFNERYLLFVESYKQLIKTLSGSNHNDKLQRARVCLGNLDNAMFLLAKDDRPDWLDGTRNLLENLSKQSSDDTGYREFIFPVFKRFNQINDHDWSYLVSEEAKGKAALDFDSIYRKHYEESSIPNLFDEMIAKLHEMIESGLIDIKSAEAAIKKLAAFIEKNSRGSFIAASRLRDFVNEFVAGGVWGTLKEIPGLKSWVESFENTSKKMNIDWKKEFAQIIAKTRAEIDMEIPPFTPDRLPSSLVKSIESKMISAEVIDVEFSDYEEPDGRKSAPSV